MRRIRASEWIFIAYFGYVALASLAFPIPSTRPVLVAIGILAVTVVLAGIDATTQSRVAAAVRDWIALVYVLMAYREMDWFTPATKDLHFESAWIVLDRRLLHDWGLKSAIETLGSLIPGFLEFCYLLVYGIGPFSVAAFYVWGRRERANRFLIVFAVGALGSYALFPYFPSDPPRVVFSGADLPTYLTALRQLNLSLVGNYGIHSSVFPSAHVSAAFASAWGLIRFLPEWPWVGRGMLIYAVCVSLATIYGRYHYAVDTIAGFAISLIALTVALRLPRQTDTSEPRNDPFDDGNH